MALALTLAAAAAWGCGRSEGASPESRDAAEPASARATLQVEVSDRGGRSSARPADLALGWIGVVLPREAVAVAADRADRLEVVLVEVGDRVRRGEPLARLETSLLRDELHMAEAALRVAEAEAEGARLEAEQARSRYDRRAAAPELISREEIATAEISAQVAQARRVAANARVAERQAEVARLHRRIAESEIRAPFSGTVAARFLDTGATVQVGTPVLRLVADDTPTVRFAVPPEEIGGVLPGARVTLTSDAGDGLGVARVVRVAPEIDLAAQRVLVEALVETGSVHPGLGVRVSRDDTPPEGGRGRGGPREDART